MGEIRNRLWALGLGLWLGLAAALCFDYGLAESWEFRLLDLLPPSPSQAVPAPHVIRITPSSTPGEQATRLDYALVFRALKDHPPRLLLADLPLHEEDIFSTAYDSQLFEQLRAYNKIYFGAHLVGEGSGEASSLHLPQPLVKGSIDQLPRYGTALVPEEMFRTLGNLAADNLPAAAPGGRVPLLFNYNGSLLPSLSLAGLVACLGGDWTQCEIRPGRSIHVRDPEQHSLAVIPIDFQGNALLRFPQAQPLPSVELADVILASEQLFNGEKPVIDLEPLQGEILMIGLDGHADKTPGIAEHARILEALLQKRYLQRPHDQATAGLLLAVCLLASQFALLRPSAGFLALGALLAFSLGGWFWLVQARQLAFPGGLASLSLLMAWTGSRLLFHPGTAPAPAVRKLGTGPASKPS
jgi:hypothetical protein